MLVLLEPDGWHLVRVKGSHRQFKHPTKPGTVTLAGKLSADILIGTEWAAMSNGHRERVDLSTYAIIIERGESGSFGAYSPDLPGCVAVADDQDECLRLLREAVDFHIAGLRADGEPVPEPGTVAVTTITTAA